MKNLFRSFLNSLYNPEWLKKNRFEANSAWSYFSLFVFVFSVIITIRASILIWPVVKEAQKTFVTEVPDFEAVFDKGSLTVQRLKQPYIYRNAENDFALVVDTIRTTTASFADYITSTPEISILITSEKAEISDNKSGQSRIQNWKNAPDSRTTKEQVVDSMKNILRMPIYFVGMLIVFIGLYIGYFIGKLYTVAVVALVAYVFSRFTGREFKLKDLFVMGLYAITLPAIVDLLFTMVGLEISYIQFITLLAFMLAVVFTEKPKEIVD